MHFKDAPPADTSILNEEATKLSDVLDKTGNGIKQIILETVKSYPINDSTFREYYIFLRRIRGLCEILQDQVLHQAGSLPQNEPVKLEKKAKGISDKFGV